MDFFNRNCTVGITAGRDNSPMPVTALNSYIGYSNTAETAKKAHAEGIPPDDACVSLGFLTAEPFDKVFHPEEFIREKAFSWI